MVEWLICESEPRVHGKKWLLITQQPLGHSRIDTSHIQCRTVILNLCINLLRSFSSFGKESGVALEIYKLPVIDCITH